MIQLNVNAVVAAVRQVAAEYPEAIYEAGPEKICLYTAGQASGVPLCGCLIGIAIRRVSEEAADKLAEMESMGVDRGTLPNDFRKLGIEWVGDDVDKNVDWLCDVQGHQDADACWRDAVAQEDAVESTESNGTT